MIFSGRFPKQAGADAGVHSWAKVLAARLPMCPPCPFAVGTELSAGLQSNAVLVKPLQISSAPQNPVCPCPAQPFVPSPCLAGTDAQLTWGESVQGNEPAGNYLLVWGVFCWLRYPNQLPVEGGQVPAGGRLVMPRQAWGRG